MQDPSLALRMTFDSNKKESRSKERLSVNLLSCNKLLAQCTSDINCDSHSSTNHWVVADTEEAHHLNVCWN